MTSNISLLPSGPGCPYFLRLGVHLVVLVLYLVVLGVYLLVLGLHP